MFSRQLWPEDFMLRAPQTNIQPLDLVDLGADLLLMAQRKSLYELFIAYSAFVLSTHGTGKNM